MKELRPEVKAFLENARDADNPTAADRARLRKAVFHSVAAASAAVVLTQGATAQAAAQSAALSGAAAAKGALGAGALFKTASVLVVSALLGTTAAVWSNYSMQLETAVNPLKPEWVDARPLNSKARAPLSKTIEMEDNSSIKHPQAQEGREERGETPAPRKNAISAREPALSNQSDSSEKNAAANTEPENKLEDETRGLREAHQALQAGDSDQAIRLLDEQSREFEQGELAQERAAARVLALCQSSRALEAKAALQSFLSQNPNSPLADRVRGACKALTAKE